VLDPEVASWFGEALGTWHLGATSLRGLSGPTPWLLLIGTEQRLPVLDSEAELKELVARILADPTLRTVMDRVREEWRRLTVIHGDIRFANVMVRTSPPSVRFVDWETSGLGDPLWDVAGAVQEYISVGAAGGNEFAESPAEPAVIAFLAAYRQACDLPFPSSRLPRFVACRLLMRAIQLANWEGDAAEGIEDHLELARQLATDARELPESWLSRIMPE
jgi:aminoglycoside phosphotransferase (APT) family kinase protein